MLLAKLPRTELTDKTFFLGLLLCETRLVVCVSVFALHVRSADCSVNLCLSVAVNVYLNVFVCFLQSLFRVCGIFSSDGI